MAIVLTYLRPFFPAREEDIRTSPFGRPYAALSWATHEGALELEVEELLEEVRKRHGIPFQVRLFSSPRFKQPEPSIHVESSEALQGELVGKGKGLAGVRRVNFDRDLRAIGHMLLVEVDGILRWYEGPYYGWQVWIVQFLDNLLNRGPSYIEDLLRPPAPFRVPPQELLEREVGKADSEEERVLLRELLLSGRLGDGEPTGQVRAGYRLRLGEHTVIPMSRAGLKSIDLVYRAGPDMVWIVEAKYLLNWAALGQALGYASLYEEDFLPKEHAVKVQPAIVCREVDETVLHCAELRQVAVFVGGERRV